MKKIFLLSALLMLALAGQAQVNAIDEMFDKYGEKEGFTVVTISSKLLGMFVPRDEKEKEGKDIVGRLSSIRILSVDDSLLNKNVNFYKELSSRMSFSGYDELMAVKEGGDVTKFLVKQKGDRISELLIITGGPGSNAIISIKGDLDLKTISELSKSTGIEELKDLDKIDRKSPE